jgi:hypothetical protein
LKCKCCKGNSVLFETHSALCDIIRGYRGGVFLTSYRRRHKRCQSHLTDGKFTLYFDIDFTELQFRLRFRGAMGNSSGVLTVLQAALPMYHGLVPSKGWRVRWSSGSHAGLWFPSSPLQTRPKPLDFFCVQNPQHAFIRRVS